MVCTERESPEANGAGSSGSQSVVSVPSASRPRGIPVFSSCRRSVAALALVVLSSGETIGWDFSPAGGTSSAAPADTIGWD
ncbi:hypothetical protein Shyd_53310 [Streptomyces hydrogenans]|uniref:Uncharacterized protein n=1 Tax=Streptomyces hydrogenans TaxID=1873719 RepID=A0ABQ3PG27_9ACTN|nr:hypothetical protein GCM10018784_27340 [Streptomyces hydrogenans]GHI23960.1 hypothetical protein Shyd_53310 [Streptomyces hydrogenans]